MWVAHGELAKSNVQLADYSSALAWARRSVEKHGDNLPMHHVLIASLAQLDHLDDASAAPNRLLELDPGLTIKRLLEIFPCRDTAIWMACLTACEKRAFPSNEAAGS